MTTAPICSRCGGYHEARECLIQDLMSEILNRFGQSDIQDRAQHVAEIHQYLTGLGASDEAASAAVARWAADNDA